MLRNTGVQESAIRYYANSEMNDWVKFLSTLCILANEEIDIRRTLEEHNARQ